MAKKKQELSPEERLAAALVPEEEQPYQLPEGWKWVRLGKIYDVNPKVQADDDLEASFITMSDICPGIKSQFDSSTQKWGEIKRGHTQFANGDVAFAKISPCFENRKSMILDGLKNGIGAGTTELIVLRNSQIDNKYTFLFVSSEEFIRRAQNTYKGVVGQQRINLDFVKNYPMPLPPRAEQKRIVARIESLFAKLDAAKAKVQSVLDAHEARKTALLHEAITGKFIGTGEREWKPLSEIVDLIRIGPFGSALHKEDYIHDGIPVVNPQYIVNQEICPDNRKSISESKADSLSAYKMCVNDIIIGRRGEMGRTAPVGEREAGWLCGTGCMLLRLKKEYNANFYSRVIASQQSKQYLEAHAVGSTMKNLNEKIIRNLPVPIYSVSEQQEIARILDRLLDREEKVRQSAESVLESIDRMKQSILARAFRGEL